MKSVIASIKLFLFALNVMWICALQPIVMFFTKGKHAFHLTFIFQNLWRMCLGIKIVVKGTPCTDKHVLFMGNHLSYLDIPAIASVIKHASFVAKSEVEGWPLAGFLSSLQQTTFIQRKRSKIIEEKNNIQKRVDDGDNLIIFPEGTSTSGLDILPFKSSLFMLVLGENNESIYIQPFTIDILDIDGKQPKTKDERDIYAWPRDVDIDLHHHLWRFAKVKGATLQITFHDPIRAKDYTDRKALAKDCHEIAVKGLVVHEAA